MLLNSGFRAFTDLATKGICCQARSAAIFLGLTEAGRIDEVKTPESFFKLFYTKPDGTESSREAYQCNPFCLKNDIQVVSCTVKKDQIVTYYEEHCNMLTNKKEKDNYLDLRSEKFLFTESNEKSSIS